MKTFLFPGQGSQAKGMGGSLFEEFDEYVKKADQILGYSVKELCISDPKGQLGQTQFTQPALYVVNALSYFKKLDENGFSPDFVAGHSLGEFNALLAAECFDFETGLKLVKKRGELMSQATGGAMAAIINASKEEIETILKENDLRNIDLANYNSASQIVISGLKEEIGQAQSLFKEDGMMYFPLNTSGAFHSRYMQAAKEQFESYINEFKFSELKIPVISNVSGQPYEQGDVITNISSQMTSAVKWNESIQYLLEQGDMEFEELGHGNVLSKLLNKIREERLKSLADSRGLEESKQSINKDSKSGIVTPVVIDKNLGAEEKVKVWNRNYSIGTKVKSLIIEDNELQTRTEAMVLFGHRAAVYMQGYNGYFDIDELTPSS